MKIFIGSSREALDDVREIASWLEGKGHEPITWDQPGLFAPGEQTFYKLINIANLVDGAIFLFGEDDKVWYRGDGVPQPRDNVLIEYGLFVGKLGPLKAVICRNGNPKHAADLQGITYIDVSTHTRARGQLSLERWARSLESAPEDPAQTQLHAEIALLKKEKERLEQRIAFEADKASDLEKIIKQEAGIDFSSYAESDSRWKLLFDYEFFEKSAQIMSESFLSPVDMRKNIVDAGLQEVSDLIAWYSPGDPDKVKADASPDKRRFYAKKLLRVFRRQRVWEEFNSYIEKLPLECKGKINKITAEIERKKSVKIDLEYRSV